MGPVDGSHRLVQCSQQGTPDSRHCCASSQLPSAMDAHKVGTGAFENLCCSESAICEFSYPGPSSGTSECLSSAGPSTEEQQTCEDVSQISSAQLSAACSITGFLTVPQSCSGANTPGTSQKDNDQGFETTPHEPLLHSTSSSFVTGHSETVDSDRTDGSDPDVPRCAQSGTLRPSSSHLALSDGEEEESECEHLHRQLEKKLRGRRKVPSVGSDEDIWVKNSTAYRRSCMYVSVSVDNRSCMYVSLSIDNKSCMYVSMSIDNRSCMYVSMSVDNRNCIYVSLCAMSVERRNCMHMSILCSLFTHHQRLVLKPYLHEPPLSPNTHQAQP